MRFPRIYEEDGCCTATVCDLCGGEIYQGRLPGLPGGLRRELLRRLPVRRGGGPMVRRENIPWEELQRLNAQGWSYRRLAEKYGVSSSAIGRRAVLEGWHGTNDQRANARLRNLAARLRRQAEQRLTEDLDTREIKELTAVLRELMNLQQTLEGQQPGGVVRVELAEETEDWSL